MITTYNLSQINPWPWLLTSQRSLCLSHSHVHFIIYSTFNTICFSIESLCVFATLLAIPHLLSPSRMSHLSPPTPRLASWQGRQQNFVTLWHPHAESQIMNSLVSSRLVAFRCSFLFITFSGFVRLFPLFGPHRLRLLIDNVSSRVSCSSCNSEPRLYSFVTQAKQIIVRYFLLTVLFSDLVFYFHWISDPHCQLAPILSRWK